MTSYLAQSYTDSANSRIEEVFDDEELLNYYSAPSPSKNQKHEHLNEDVYIGRILRRTDLIEQLRNAYLRDVVSVKQFIGQQMAQSDQDIVYQKWQESIPSLDLSQHFMLYTPQEQSLAVIPCETCGGSLEIVHHDNEKLTFLANDLERVKERARLKINEFGILIAQKNGEIEKLEEKMENSERTHRSELKVMSTEMVDMKTRLDALSKANVKLTHSCGAHKAEVQRLTRLTVDASATEQTLIDTSAELARVTAELKRVSESLVRENDRVVKLNEKLNEVTLNRDELKKICAGLSDEVDDLQGRLKAALDVNERNSSTLESLEKHNHKLRHRMERSTTMCEELENEKKRLREEVESSLQKSVHAKDQWTREEGNLKRTIERLIAGQESLNVTIDKLRDELSDATFESKRLKETCERQEGVIEQQEEDVRGLRREGREKDRRIGDLEQTADVDQANIRRLEEEAVELIKALGASRETSEYLEVEVGRVKQAMAAVVMESKQTHSRAIKAESELTVASQKLNDLKRAEEERATRRTILRMKALERRQQGAGTSVSPSKEASENSLSDSPTSTTATKLSPTKTKSTRFSDRLPSLLKNKDSKKVPGHLEGVKVVPEVVSEAVADDVDSRRDAYGRSGGIVNMARKEISESEEGDE